MYLLYNFQDNKTNLLEFVLSVYCQMYETEIDVSCPTRFRLPEPSNMRHAAQVCIQTVHITCSCILVMDNYLWVS